MKIQRQLGLIGLAVVIVSVLTYGFLPRAKLVDVTTVTKEPLQVSVMEEGKTRVIDRFIISAPVAGYIRRLELDVGDAIKQGQQIVNLDPLRPHVLDERSRAEAKARVAAAKAALLAAEQNASAAEATMELAKEEYRRIKDLRKKQLVSQDEEDRASANARATVAAQRSAEFSVEVARHELGAARTILAYSAAKNTGDVSEHVDITAPINGSILKVYRKSEGVVEAGAPLIEVGNPKALEVEVDVLSADAVRIKPGMLVLFERWGGVDPLKGRVRKVEPVGFTKISALGVEEQRVLVIVDITSDPKEWESLGDKYRVEARFVLWEQDNVLQIPTSALFRFQNDWAVFVLDSDRAYRRTINIGRQNGLMAQILDGLAENEKIIVYPDDTLSDGTKVKIRTYN